MELGDFVCFHVDDAERRATPHPVDIAERDTFPSGDQDAISADVSMLVTRLVWPVFMSRTQMSCNWPPRSLDHASCDPSADQAGSASRNRSFVRFTGLPPIGITHRSPSAVKATCFPSGD